MLWAQACGMQFRVRDIICADHFSDADIIYGAKRANLMPNAVPYHPALFASTSSSCIPEVPVPSVFSSTSSNCLPAVQVEAIGVSYVHSE